MYHVFYFLYPFLAVDLTYPTQFLCPHIHARSVNKIFSLRYHENLEDQIRSSEVLRELGVVLMAGSGANAVLLKPIKMPGWKAKAASAAKAR